MFWRVHNNRWWGEGEVKFYIDGDDKYPTICTTGAEDYFCGSFNFEDRKAKRYQSFNTPYAGVPQIVLPDGLYQAVLAFGMYRWHIPDPIHFNKDMRVTVQDMGYHQSVDPNKRLFRKQYSDISSVAYWYQTEPHAPFPALPKKYDLTIE